MSDQPKQINFTIVPADDSGAESSPRTYANFCSIAHTPFDFTLTFCEVLPLSEKEIREAVRFHIDGLKEDGLLVPAPTSIADYIEA